MLLIQIHWYHASEAVFHSRRVNWWDAPTNPDVWQKDQLAWWTIGAYTGLYYLVAGGGKKAEKKETK